MLQISSISDIESVSKELHSIYNGRYSQFIDGQENTAKIFFRGQNKSYGQTDNIASLFRYPRAFNESNRMKRFEDNFGNLMGSLDITTNLQKMIFMQHYGLHTRLLDITSCIYVALYFATTYGNDAEDGIITCFPNFATPNNYHLKGVIPQESQRENQRYNTSLDILIALSFLNAETKQEFYEQFAEFYKFLTEGPDEIPPHTLSYVYNRFYRIQLFCPQSIWNFMKVLHFEDIQNEYDHIPKFHSLALSKIMSKYEDFMNSQSFIKLNELLKTDLGIDHRLVIDFTKPLTESFFVTASMSNPRIQAQYGAFMLQPFSANTKPNGISKFLSAQYDPQVIRIPNSSKVTIRNELKKLGYSQKTLFPTEKKLPTRMNETVKHINSDTDWTF